MKNARRIAFCLFLGACSHIPIEHWDREPAQSRVSQQLSRESDQAIVYRKNVRPYLMRIDIPNVFNISNATDSEDLEKLKNFLLGKKATLGMNIDNDDYQLVLRSVRNMGGGRVVVTWDQVQERQVGGDRYQIPISGGALIVIIKNTRLDSVNTSLFSIRSQTFALAQPGFDLSQLSDNEMNTLSEQIKSSNNKEKIEEHFNRVIRLAELDLTFDIEAFLSMTPEQQREALNQLFGQLNRVGTYRLLIQAAQEGRLSLVRYGNKEWMYILSQPFLLDIEFDILIPKNNEEKLQVRNLRTLSREQEINVHISPFYPIELGERVIYLDENKEFKKVEGQSSEFMDLLAAQNFQKVDAFFTKNYNWNGYKGQPGEKASISIHTKLRGRYTGKAFWSENNETFGIGIDGQGWKEKAKSLSILAHEYFHAVISFSSKLVYRSQAGGLNEHLADVHGVIFEAYERNGGKFDYTIGDEDVFTQDMAKKIVKKNTEWAESQKIPPHLIEQYSVNKANLRNLYYPEASKHSQFSTYEEMLKKYPEDCEPSVDNDNCGVHFTSGVLNKALSLIINQLGLEKVKKTLFNTAVYRLNPDSNFKEYAYQLYEECYEQSLSSASLEVGMKRPTQNDCEEIIVQFSKVGVEIPLEN